MRKFPTFPPELKRYITSIFSGANRRIGEKIARVPNSSEESMDMTLIEYLSQYSCPRVVVPGWSVRIDVHFLGGLRHWQNWEIADIGVLVFAKRGSLTIGNKVALLQSKRLYPSVGDIDEASLADYRIGMGRLVPDQVTRSSLAQSRTFKFDSFSRYKALKKNDDQYIAIKSYEDNRKIPIHYLLHNPWEVPSEYTFPIFEEPKLGFKKNGGCRVVPACNLREVLEDSGDKYSPTFGDMKNSVSLSPAHEYGWRLEHFITNRVLGCYEGHLFSNINDENIFQLFNRRSGPISAAMSIVIEQVE